ncbi:hypothetical protein F4776DRAFT_491673 [Hypoxylon sp. NC0597]|nr:hypothetical protein F4776DRAFT_491673 [Hypoxylon sp. NC0597]
MQFTKAAIVFLCAVSGVSAGCYPEGQSGNFGKDLKAKNLLGLACRALKGSFYSKEERTTCVRDDNNIKWNLKFKNTGDKAKTLDESYCISKLEYWAYNCKNGGKGTADGWLASSDPNRGDCVGTVQTTED